MSAPIASSYFFICACIRAKYWLGYTTAKQDPIYGDLVDGLLTGRTKLPPEQQARRAARLKEAARTPLREKALARAVKDIGMKEAPANSNRCPITARWGFAGSWCCMAVSCWYIDAGSKAFKLHVNWAYVPALRRVRAVSPTNRSDGFLGSDMSQDDGNFFDGKPEDFEWKLVGRREGLRFTDPDSIAGKAKRVALPGGGWRTPFIDNDRSAGFQVKDWKGVAWAPVAAALSKRSMWVLEGVPKDKYYLYGKIELWIDDYTYAGAWNRRYSWKGELMNTYQITMPATEPFNATERFWASTFAYQCAENLKANRATLGGPQPTPDSPQDRRLPLKPSMFDYQSLSAVGK